ncbi:MAG: helix-turn-helix domain-containing protein [Thermaerobacter sp.]|nr:helix-turn-helix domain-containing protein [Thermaerobacter sp.]
MDMATHTPFTVEIQQSFDPTVKTWQQRVFIKLYTEALTSGFLAALSDRDWKTLCVIALHMDSQGRCYPSRDAIAQALGVNRSTASERIHSLLAFRWQGQPLVQATRDRQPDGTLGRQVYTILPVVPLGFGPDTPRPDPEAPPSAADSAADPTMSGNADMVQEHHVGVSQLGFIQLGKSRPLLTRSRINKIQRKQDPGSREKDLPPDPSTPSESSDLTPQGVPPREASVMAAQDARPCPIADRPDRNGRLATPLPTALGDTLMDQPDTVSLPEHRENETAPEDALVGSPRPKDVGRSQPPQAQALAARLKEQLQARGVTVFPRDWHLKAAASATLLLRSLSVSDVEALMDWALAHPFWGDKLTQMRQLVSLAPEWQQARDRPRPARWRGSGPPRDSGTVMDRNMALLRRLYAETLEQEVTQVDATG